MLLLAYFSSFHHEIYIKKYLKLITQIILFKYEQKHFLNFFEMSAFLTT